MTTAGYRGWASSPWGFIRRTFTAAYEDNILFLASALTFQALVASLPIVLLALASLGYFVRGADAAVEDIRQLLESVVPTAGPGMRDPFSQVERFVEVVVSSRAQLSIYGLPLFLWFSTRFFSGARSALNDVFDTQETRPWFVGIGIDFFLVIATLVLVVFNAVVTVEVMELPWLGRFASTITTFGLALVSFFIIYTMAPTRRVRWDTALVAAIVAALGFEVTKKLYVVYVVRFTTLDRLISSSNGIALLLLVVWMYAIVCVFLIGAEVGETYDMRRRQREQRAILT
ncbi:MAG: YihY family inner membrane protein [Gemmatimonadota bacterium]|nr:MAG: YihY family inner membrane protein [Gemmatimonadota bacterium]